MPKACTRGKTTSSGNGLGKVDICVRTLTQTPFFNLYKINLTWINGSSKMLEEYTVEDVGTKNNFLEKTPIVYKTEHKLTNIIK